MLRHFLSNQTARLTRYGATFNSHDLLKVLAISLMIVDHIGLYLLADNSWCRLVGRLAAPLFFFLIGYSGKLHSRLALLIYGTILSFVGYTVHASLEANILLNFIIISYVLSIFAAEQLSTFTRAFFFIALSILNIYLYFYIEYGGFGLLFAYCARLCALKDKQAEFWLIMTLIEYYLWEGLYFQFFLLPFGMVIFGLLIIGLFQIMQNYRLKPLFCPKVLLWPGLILSRYSLEVYFIHLMLLYAYKILHFSLE